MDRRWGEGVEGGGDGGACLDSKAIMRSMKAAGRFRRKSWRNSSPNMAPNKLRNAASTPHKVKIINKISKE